MTNYGRGSIPYFEVTLDHLEQGNPEAELALGRHYHYGYWDNPAESDGSLADFAEAGERLTARMCEWAGVRDEITLLDVGCGFGGTIASINERFDGVDLVGVNFDIRQIERAQRQVVARPGNRVGFSGGNAMALPLPDNAFDIVFAIECAFHFPDRQQFFHEAWRVLRPGGVLAMTDFACAERTQPLFRGSARTFSRILSPWFGHWDLTYTLPDFHAAATRAGFVSVAAYDITAPTLPSFTAWKYLTRTIIQNRIASELFNFFEWLHHTGQLSYMSLIYRRPEQLVET